jgi:hypothetical protein
VVLHPSSEIVDEAASAAVDGTELVSDPLSDRLVVPLVVAGPIVAGAGPDVAEHPTTKTITATTMPRTAASLPGRRPPNVCQPPPNGLPTDRPGCRSARSRTGSTGLSDMLTPEGPVMGARLPEFLGESHRLSTPVATAPPIEGRRRGPVAAAALPASGQGAPPGRLRRTTPGQRATSSSLG